MESSEYFKGKQYHIGAGPGDLAEHIILCGDPDRARKVSGFFDKGSVRAKGSHREYVWFTGTYRDMPISVLATGIGPDNVEIAVIEATQCVESPTFIRVGSCGAIAEGVKVGDLVVSKDAIPREMTSGFYLPAGTRVEGTKEVIVALEKAADAIGATRHTGTTCSTSSFYAGQGREVPGFPIREESKKENLFPRLLEQGVINFEMETSLLYTLANISKRNIRAGTVCAVYAARQTGEGFDKNTLKKAEERCIRVGLEAMKLLV